jgi:K+-sensing histidine kinase KdpD
MLPRSTAPPDSKERAVVRALRHSVGDLLQCVYATAHLIKESPDPDIYLQLVQNLRNRADRTRVHIDAIHDYCHALNLTSAPINPLELIQRVTERVKRQFPLTHIQSRSQKDLPSLQGDEKYLEQALEVLLAAAAHSAKRIVYLHTKSFDKGIIIEVQDDGPGVSPQELHQMFSPYTSSTDGYLGLPMALLHEVVIAHGGSLQVYNCTNGGLNTTVKLPAHSRNGTL